MDYSLAYQRLIAKARERVCPEGYVERHHVLPRALGGSDDSSNIVALTSREHFIAHALLARIHGGIMWQALIIMKKGRNYDRYINARIFAAAREKAAKARESLISPKRAEDPAFDEYMRSVRSLATSKRVEGYQREVGQKLTQRMAVDPAYAERIREGKRKAQEASAKIRAAKRDTLAKEVLTLRASGMLYKDIAQKIGRSQAFVCKVIKSQEVKDACLS